LTSFLTLFDKYRTPSTARTPFVRSSPDSPSSLVLISRGSVSSSSLEISLSLSH